MFQAGDRIRILSSCFAVHHELLRYPGCDVSTSACSAAHVQWRRPFNKQWPVRKVLCMLATLTACLWRVLRPSCSLPPASTAHAASVVTSAGAAVHVVAARQPALGGGLSAVRSVITASGSGCEAAAGLDVEPAKQGDAWITRWAAGNQPVDDSLTDATSNGMHVRGSYARPADDRRAGGYWSGADIVFCKCV